MQNTTQKSSRVLVFCVALNFYDIVYDRNIASQRRYANRYGYAYEVVRRPLFATTRESVWLKVPLIRLALSAGWDWVLFVDADCEIRPTAPRVETLADGQGSIFLAPGFSGNVNSGVIASRNTPEAAQFFDRVFQAADRKVPEADWGENGHIIHFAKCCPAIKMIDRRWNNNSDTQMADFIRHYSAGGAMRPLYRLGPAAHMAKLAARCIQKWQKLANRQDGAPSIQNWFQTVMGPIIATHGHAFKSVQHSTIPRRF